jgi:hypothetical protein
VTNLAERDTNLRHTSTVATAVSAPVSSAGPIDPDQAERLPTPPFVDIHPLLQLLHFNQR